MSASGDEWSALLAKANPVIQAWFCQTGVECCSDVRGMWPDPPTCSAEFMATQAHSDPDSAVEVAALYSKASKKALEHISDAAAKVACQRRSLLMETVPAARPSTQPELFYKQRHRVRSLLSHSPGPVAAPVRAEQRGPGRDAVAFKLGERFAFACEHLLDVRSLGTFPGAMKILFCRPSLLSWLGQRAT